MIDKLFDYFEIFTLVTLVSKLNYIYFDFLYLFLNKNATDTYTYLGIARQNKLTTTNSYSCTTPETLPL